MPDPNLQSYLAAHYLSGPKADAILARTSADGKVKRKKKKPRTDDSSSSGLVFKDDSDSWNTLPAADEDEDGLTPQVVGSASAGPSKAFRKIGSTRPKEGEEEVNADEVESKSEEIPEFKAGLRTKEEMKAARLAREERKRREAARTPPPSSTPAKDEDDEEARLAQQTVYRDSSGRVIDIAAAEAAERELEQERKRKEAERATWGQGLVQKQQRQAAAAELASVRDQGVSRRVTDSEYNKHFREQERADDPALAFLTKKRVAGPQKTKYKGPYPPNRFNIPPGYRWDGVDRGNGFEKAFFERKAALERREQEARAWGQSDM